MRHTRRIAGGLKPSLTYANVVSTLCLFILLGGTAFAAAQLTGRDIRNNSLRGKDIRNASLAGRDVKNNRLTGLDVRDLRRADFAPGEAPLDGAPGPEGDRGPAGPAGPPGPSLGRTHNFVCNPGGADVECSSVTLTQEQPGRVLLILTGGWHEQGAGPDGARGFCTVEADGEVVMSRGYGQDTPTHVAAAGAPYSGTIAISAVTDALPAGDHEFTVTCAENEPDIVFQTGLSAVALGSG